MYTFYYIDLKNRGMETKCIVHGYHTVITCWKEEQKYSALNKYKLEFMKYFLSPFLPTFYQISFAEACSIVNYIRVKLMKII